MRDNSVFNKMFLWLGIGLLISFSSGYVLSNNYDLFTYLVSNIGFFPILISSLIIAFVLKIFIHKLPLNVARILYVIYSLIMGITLSTVFIIYEMSSIILVFLITAAIFIALSIYGYTTKKDLSKLGTILFISILVIIVASLINMFILKSGMAEIVLCAASALAFALFIAYDINKIKNMLGYMDDDKLAIYGAFDLYLDFINLFLDLIRLFGKRK